MELEEILWIASKFANKGYDFEKMKYSDDLYGREGFADNVWEYMEEFKDIGRIRFYEKYKAFKLY